MDFATTAIDGKVVRPCINWFGKYKAEVPQVIEKQKIIVDETLSRLREKFERVEIIRGKWLFGDTTKPSYSKALSLLKGLKYSSKDIETFSIALAEFQEEKDFEHRAGVFLSVLINSCKEKDFTIITKHLLKKTDCIGYLNTKNITIYGDAGGYVGSDMGRGRILVKGSVGISAGLKMKGGELIIEGDSGKWVGTEMTGGEITIKGDVGPEVGTQMSGGKIYLEGDYTSIGAVIRDNAAIYHNGSVIRKGEKWVSLW